MDIYGRIIAPDGSFVTAEVLLNAQVAGEQSNAFAVALSGGGFVGLHYDAALGAYVGQVFDALASPQEVAYTLPGGAAPGAFLASAEALSDDRIVVAWERGAGDVVVQILDPRGGNVAGTAAADTLFGGSGADDISGFDGNDTVWAGAGNDTLSGGAGQDMLDGGAGDDMLIADRDGDRLSGGEGFDRADFSDISAAIWVDLATGGATQTVWSRASAGPNTGQWQRIAEIDGVEAIIGTNFVDQVYGDADNDYFMMAPDGAAHGMDFFDGRGGEDWADFSQFDTAIWVDLTLSVKEVWTRDGPTVLSGVWREIMDLANVENVVGTVAADHFAGNAQNNTFVYVAGAVAPSRVDIINGRGGTDTADFSRFDEAIWVDMAFSGSAVWTRDGGDVLSGAWRALASLQEVENVIGTRGIDQFYGNELDNSFSYVSDLTPMPAQTPLEIMDGRGGTDTADFSLFGAAIWVSFELTDAEVWTRLGPTLGSGTWADIVNLVSIETVVGTNFDDHFIGNGADNTFFGGQGNDILRGNGGRDSLFGGAGDDRLIGDGDLDLLSGGAGSDTVDYSGFGAAVWVDLSGTGFEVWTRDGGDVTSGIWRAIADVEQVENLLGTMFSDRLKGDGAGNTLAGGAGDDLLIGGLGADTFVFLPGGGADVIADFHSGVDTVLLAQTGLEWGDLGMVQNGSDAVITYGAPGDQITLSGVQLMDLTEADFVFL